MNFHSQINDSKHSLIECSDLGKYNLEDGYRIVPQVSTSWKTAERRLLVVVETVDSLDLRNQSLLSGRTEDPGSYRGDSDHNPMRSILSNVLDISKRSLKYYGLKEEAAEDYAFGIVNFNAKKIRHLDAHQQQAAFPAFTSRVISVIAALKPTHVLVCGDTANMYMLSTLESPEGTTKRLRAPKVAENCEFKRGWFFTRKVGKHSFSYVPTLDLESLYNPSKKVFDEDDEDESEGNDKYAAADLLHFVSENMANLFAGKMLHDLSHIKPNPIYVDTIEKFDEFYAKLIEAPRVATDLETRSLSNLNNRIYIAQFALSVDAAYVIPVKHPESPFSEEESDYIYRKIRKFLRSKKRTILIFINGVFDTRIFRTQLDLDIIPYHQIWEITAGEQLLDENIGLFGRFKLYMNGEYIKTSYQNLRNVFCKYGNDRYYRMAFSKEERHLTGSVRPDDPDMLDYAALDAQSIFAMSLEQEKRAHAQIVKPSKSAGFARYSRFFTTHLLNQMSNTVQAISHMEETGSPVDMEYLEYLMGPKSPLHKLMKETLAEMVQLPNVKEADKRILNSAGKATASLFGDDVSMSVFDPNKKAHKEVLFFDVMRLPVIGYTKTKQRAIDKNFTAAYRNAHKEVEMMETLSKTGKLLSTYVKGWIKNIRSSVDSAADFCLRPSFGFFTIVTGRLNSFDPSLQQVPSRGKLADYIKRAFVPPVGYLLMRYDYSAHEIRGWSILSGDKAVASSFQAGLTLRRELIQTASRAVPTEWTEETIKKRLEDIGDDPKISTGLLKRYLKILTIRSKLKKSGDFHIQNVFRVWKKWVDKSSPLRDAVKQLIFGILYGKGAKTLARDINQPLEEAQDIIKKLFEEFPDGAAWLEDAVELVQEHAHVMSPIGRVRRLWRVYTGKRGVIAAACRRAQNSPIQGFASEVGCTAAFLIMLKCYELIKELKLDRKANMPKYCRAVHDANYFITPFAFMLPFVHIMQYMATNGAADWYREIFGLEFTIEPEIELEIGASESKAHSFKWSWEIPELLTQIHMSLQHLVTLKRLDASEVESTFELILQPWKDKTYRALLQDRYPLLNVRDLDAQIEKALSTFIPPTVELKKAA